MDIVIDFEYTGLNNSFISSHEIIEMKVINVENKKAVCRNFSSIKPISAYGQLSHGCEFYEGNKFSKQEFDDILNKIGAGGNDVKYFGFGVDQDKLMLRKYGIDIEITDIRQMFQLSEYEHKLATEGSGLEVVYFMATGEKKWSVAHHGLGELEIIMKLYYIALTLEQKEFLTVMPHGHCAGMPLSRYVQEYRKAADGYRYNNVDILADSLEHEIAVLEHWYDDDYSDDESDNDDDDDLDELPY
jgi:hypothetical protein